MRIRLNAVLVLIDEARRYDQAFGVNGFDTRDIVSYTNGDSTIFDTSAEYSIKFAFRILCRIAILFS